MQVQQSFWMKVSFEIFPLGARVLLWKIEFHLLGVSSVVLPVWCGLNGGKNTRQWRKRFSLLFLALLTYHEWSWIYRQMKTCRFQSLWGLLPILLHSQRPICAVLYVQELLLLVLLGEGCPSIQTLVQLLMVLLHQTQVEKQPGKF